MRAHPRIALFDTTNAGRYLISFLSRDWLRRRAFAGNARATRLPECRRSAPQTHPTLKFMSQRTLLLLSLLAFSLAPLGVANAQTTLGTGLGGARGYGTSCVTPNDDGSSSVIDISSAFPDGLRFFSGTYTQLWVNNNGNITFRGSLGTYTPDPFPVADQPMIAPYWADVDTRPSPAGCTTDNNVWWAQLPGAFIVTWDDVGYYSQNTDLRMSFQLILRAVDTCSLDAGSDFDVEFRFARCEWETGDASGGSGGFGGTPAQSGFDEGIGAAGTYLALPGSRSAGIANRMCTESNVGIAGVWRFQVRSGDVLCPDAGVDCDTGMVGVCAEGSTACVGDDVECLPVTSVATRSTTTATARPTRGSSAPTDTLATAASAWRTASRAAARRDSSAARAVCVKRRPATESPATRVNAAWVAHASRSVKGSSARLARPVAAAAAWTPVRGSTATRAARRAIRAWASVSPAATWVRPTTARVARSAPPRVSA